MYFSIASTLRKASRTVTVPVLGSITSLPLTDTMLARFFSMPVQMLMSLELDDDAVPPPVDVRLNEDDSFKPPGRVLTAMLRVTTR